MNIRNLVEEFGKTLDNKDDDDWAIKRRVWYRLKEDFITFANTYKEPGSDFKTYDTNCGLCSNVFCRGNCFK